MNLAEIGLKFGVESKLVGYVKPYYYPTALVALVERDKHYAIVYPDGTILPLGEKDMAKGAERIKMLDPENQVPYRTGGRDEFLYGIDEQHIVMGDPDTVESKLRLALSSLNPRSPAARSITEFITRERRPEL